MKRIIRTLILLGLAVCSVPAAPYHYWNGSVSTNWHDAGNWSVTNPDGASACPEHRFKKA